MLHDVIAPLYIDIWKIVLFILCIITTFAMMLDNRPPGKMGIKFQNYVDEFLDNHFGKYLALPKRRVYK